MRVFFRVLSSFTRYPAAWLCAGAVFVALVAAGEMAMRALEQERAHERYVQTLSYATTVRVRLERELTAAFRLNSGFAAYLVVRRRNLDAREILDIMAELHRQGRYVVNAGVAVGYRLLYVYPSKGNEKAVGLYYPDVPDQWPVVKKIAQSGQAALAGPLNLVQGGRGLLYRVPIMINGKYWGLLSTVLDSDALIRAVRDESLDARYEFAVRGRDGQGLEGGPIWGDPAVFEREGHLLQEVEVPGGYWIIAARPIKGAHDDWGLRWGARIGSLCASAVFAAMLFLLIRNRSLMAQRALYDALTGLPNRRLFEDRAQMAFSRQQRQAQAGGQQLCALLFLDLDDFKLINDQYGHKAGDEALKVMAERMQEEVRSNDTVARLGGDEFVVLLESVSEEMLKTIAGRLRDSIQQPLEYQGQTLRLGASIGVALYPDEGRTLDELLHAADQQMYGDKKDRKSDLFARAEP